MTTLTGIIQYKIFAEGTKSESSRPYIVLENGSQILLYKKNDNPFENIGFSSYEGQKVLVEEDVTQNKGVISIYGERWDARVDEDICIEKGSEARIIRNESLIMFVEKI